MTKNRIIKYFTGVTILILLSKLLGFLREFLIARNIGTTGLADAYTSIFGIPTLLFSNIGIALSSVNIPNLTHYMLHKTAEERRNYVSNLFSQISLFASVFSAIGIMLAPAAARLIAPGLANGISAISIMLTRIMFPVLLFVSLAYAAAGILQVHKRFFASSLISIPFNIAIIVALLIWKNNVMALGYATSLGWFLQFLIQLPVLVKEKYMPKLLVDFRNREIQAIYRHLIPILIGNAALQVCLVTDRAFATLLEEGSAAALSYGSNLFIIITSVFIVAMSTVTFPELSKYCEEKNNEKLKKLIVYIFKVMLVVLVPYLLIAASYSADIIRLIYERGTFTARSTQMTAAAFLIYSFCLAGYACQEVFNRLFFALKKYAVPMKVSLLCISVNLLFQAFAWKRWGNAGIAGSTAAAMAVYTVAITLAAGKEIGGFPAGELAGFCLKLVLPSAGMMGVFLAFKHLSGGGIAVSFLLPLLLGGIMYLLASFFTGALKDTILGKYGEGGDD